MEKPNCYKCKYRKEIPGDCHSKCVAIGSTVTGHNHGKQMGWFNWPWNFDPTWLLTCNGFTGKDELK